MAFLPKSLSTIAGYLSLVGILIWAFAPRDSRTRPRKSYQQPSNKAGANLGSFSKLDELSAAIVEKLQGNIPLSRREKKLVEDADYASYKEKRQKGFDEVSNRREAVMLRNYVLRDVKTKGVFRPQYASLAEILFPGEVPIDYSMGEEMIIFADQVTSRLNPLPYEYYDLPLGSLNPHVYKYDWMKRYLDTDMFGRKGNLSARLQGHHILPAPIKITALYDVPCTVMSRVLLRGEKLRWLRRLIERQYRVHLYLDGLPVLMRDPERNLAVPGYPVGFQMPWRNPNTSFPKYDILLYNHLKFTVTYHIDPERFEGIRITGFDVRPVSIKHDVPTRKKDEISTCHGVDVGNDPNNYLSLAFDSTSGLDVLYSYDITWQESNKLFWSDRWDVYALNLRNHYFYQTNNLLLTLTYLAILTALMLLVVVRNLRKDIKKYQKSEAATIEEQVGWKAIQNDVFCPPHAPMLLSVLVGTGAQIGTSLGLSIVLYLFHVTNSIKVTNAMKMGQQFLTFMLVLYPLCGVVAGYLSSRIYVLCGGSDWKWNATCTAIGLPGVFGSIFVGLNFLVSFSNAATTVPFGDILCLVMLWVGVSAPMVILGAYIGVHKVPAMKPPTEIHKMDHAVPRSTSPEFIVLVFRSLGYSACVYAPFFLYFPFVWKAMWHNDFIIYRIGFLLAVLVMPVVICAEISITSCYSQFRAQDHRWWWNSFAACGMSGVFLFAQCVAFAWSYLDREWTGSITYAIYWTYSVMISVCFGLVSGSVGFLASLWFTRTIYEAVDSHQVFSDDVPNEYKILPGEDE